jgi:hypothetical protein
MPLLHDTIQTAIQNPPWYSLRSFLLTPTNRVISISASEPGEIRRLEYDVALASQVEDN